MPFPLKVLLVEDHPYSREVMGLWLEQHYEQVLSAGDGLEALELLKAHPDIRIVLTDWMMPRMDGMELCRQARSLARDQYLHILVFTARTQREDLLTALQAGADAFVHKPVDLAELQAQMDVARRIIDLQEQAFQKMEALLEARRKMEMDLEAAGRIQRSMLPQGPPDLPGVRFAWAFESSGLVGGDMFGVVDLGEGRVGVHVLDVCGSGAHAALLAVGIGWVLRPAGLLTTATESGVIPTPPDEVARCLNRRFPLLSRSEQYFSLLYGVLDTRSGRLTAVRAGQPPPIRVGEDGVHPLQIPLAPPLGVLPEGDLEIQSAVHDLRPGEKVFFYSDGLLRVLGRDGLPAPVSELVRFLEPLRGMDLQSTVEALRAEVAEVRREGLEDDVVVVGFELESAPA